MYSFRDIKTKEKIKKIKVEDVNFEYENLEQIDEKLKEFQQQILNNQQEQKINKEKSERQLSLQQKNRTTIYKPRQKSQFVSDQNNEDIKQLIQNNQKLNLDEMRMAQIFDNSIFATIFESLIIQSVVETTGNSQNIMQNHEDDFGISNQVLQSFGISLISLRYKKNSEKVQFIKIQMQKILEKLLKIYDINQQQKENQRNQSDYQFKIKKQQMENQQIQNKDKFQIVNTKYENMKNKLNQTLIRYLGEYEDFLRCLRLNDNQQNYETLSQFLKKIQVDTTQIVKQINDGYDDKEFDQQNCLSKIDKKIKDSLIKIFDQQSLNNENLIWNQDMEKQYRQKQIDILDLFYHEIQGGYKVNDIGLTEILNTIMNQQAKQGSRENILSKFILGQRDNISNNDIKFLADSSLLLQNCINKKYAKDLIQKLDSDVLNQIELQLSESIIKRYEYLKNQLKDIRHQFFKQCVKNTKQQIKQHEEDQFQKNKIINQMQNFKIHCQKIKTIDRILEQKKQQKLQQDKDELKEIYEQKYDNQYQQEQALQNQIKIQNERQMQSIIERKKLLSRYDPKKKSFFSKEDQKRHYFHPPSKLVLYQPDVVDKLVEVEANICVAEFKENQFKKIEEQQNQLKVSLYRAQKHIYRPQYSQHYSGGPKQSKKTNENQHILYIHRYHLDKVIMIQKNFRLYKARKKLFDKIKDQTLKKNNQKIEYVERLLKGRSRKISENRSKISINNFTDDQRSTENIFNSQKNLQKSIIKDNQRKQNSQSTRKLKSSSFHSFNSTRASSFHVQKKDQQFTQKNFQLKHLKLFELVTRGKLDTLLNYNFIYNKKDLDIQDRDKNTPLYYAVKRQDMNFINYFLHYHADPNIKCKNGDTAVHIAFQLNNYDIILELLRFNANLNILNNDKNTPLSLGSLKLLKQLNLDNGVAHVKDIKNTQFDNNKIVGKRQIQNLEKPQNQKLKIKFKSMEKPSDGIVKNNLIHEYHQF